jgi:hypothetical protein
MNPANRLTVGITGHRPNRIHIGEARVARRLHDVLAALKRRSDGAHCVAISALAEGADRLFAEAALDLGYRLEALLPFASRDYETTFSDDATLWNYRTLVLRAAHVAELPGSLSDTKAAYEAVGHAVVDRSSVTIAVWDGKPAAGRGGTPEMIEHALVHLKSVIWIDASCDRSPLLLQAPSTNAPMALPLATLAARAKPLTRGAIDRLAANAPST